MMKVGNENTNVVQWMDGGLKKALVVGFLCVELICMLSLYVCVCVCV